MQAQKTHKNTSANSAVQTNEIFSIEKHVQTNEKIQVEKCIQTEKVVWAEKEDHKKKYYITVQFSSDIMYPIDFLYQWNPITFEYENHIKSIEISTGSSCTYIDKKVYVRSDKQEAAVEAYKRLKALESIYKTKQSNTTKLICIHYPVVSDRYGLFFCNIKRYAHKNVFKDKMGELLPPKDMLFEIKDIKEHLSMKQEILPTNIYKDSLLEPPLTDVPSHSKRNSVTPDDSEKSKRVKINQEMEYETTVRYTKRPAATYVKKNDDAPVNRIKESDTFENSIYSEIEPTSPILSQSKDAETPHHLSFCGAHKLITEYNLGHTINALSKGLNLAQYHKGKVSLVARFGKVLWTNVQPHVQKKIWEDVDITERTVESHQAQSLFNPNISVIRFALIYLFNSIPKTQCHYSVYEIYARVRNRSDLPYTSVIIYVEYDTSNLLKVATLPEKITDIQWIVLERKLDFQISLTTQSLCEANSEPYISFQERVFTSASSSCISYKNIPDRVIVDTICLKHTDQHNMHYPFIINIVETEELVLEPQHNTNTILAKPCSNQVKREIEVSCALHNNVFKDNLYLPIGKMASWTLNDILNGH
ncbi:hypothetical protein BDF14DRAFT_340146 [Spinellus fusiger]|nr:hypothetical protein BDF14DRAFT_340146 [Spinellus fusiger]